MAVLSGAIPRNLTGEGEGGPAIRAGSDAWLTLAIVFGLNLVSYLDRSIVAMLVPDIKRTLAVSDFQVGLILGPAFSVFFALFAIPLGWASDRFSRRLVIAAGACTFGIATALSGFAGSFVALLFARMLVATGEASLGPAAVSLISEKFPRKLLTTAISIYSTGLKLGGAAAFALGAAAIGAAGVVVHAVPELSHVAPWRLVFAITGAPAVVLAVLVFTFRETPSASRASKADVAGASAWRFIFAHGRLLVPMLIGFSMMAMCGQILVGWTPTLIGRQFGWGPAQYGPLLGAIGLVSALTLVFKGGLMDWFYARGLKDIHIRFYTWILIGALPFVAGVFLVHDVRVFVALYAVVAIVAIPFLSYANVAVQMIAPPAVRGRLAATLGIPLTLAGGMGPLLVGFLTDFVFRDEAKIGYSMAIVFCTMIPGALICFRLCLKPLREAVLAAEARDLAAPSLQAAQ